MKPGPDGTFEPRTKGDLAILAIKKGGSKRTSSSLRRGAFMSSLEDHIWPVREPRP